MSKCLVKLLIVIAVSLAARQGHAENPVSTAAREYGVMTGFGTSHVGFGETRHQIQTWDLIARAGFFLSDEVGKGSWYQGRHQLQLEIPYHLAVNHGGRSMVGGYGLGMWKFTGLESMTPYVLAGGGPLYVDLGIPTMGRKLCFSYQGGTGVQFFIDKGTTLNLEYRYHHISNAGTGSPNEPLNSNKLLFGISWYR